MNFDRKFYKGTGMIPGVLFASALSGYLIGISVDFCAGKSEYVALAFSLFVTCLLAPTAGYVSFKPSSDVSTKRVVFYLICASFFVLCANVGFFSLITALVSVVMFTCFAHIRYTSPAKLGS